MSEAFYRAMADGDLADNTCTGVVLNGWPVLLSRFEGKAHAVIDQCTHSNSPLSTGRMRHGAISCPLHGARFKLSTGQCIGNTYRALRVFEVRVADGWIEVAVPAEPPGPAVLGFAPPT